MSEHTENHEDGAVHAHVTPLNMNIGIFLALVFLTITTVGVYQINLGAMNLVVAILIATIKATLVVLFFMHMKYETKFNALIFIGSLLFCGIFLAYTINDTGHRAKLDGISGGKYDPKTGKFANGVPEGAQNLPKP